MLNTNFLPQDYQAPKTAGNYLKLQDGETKIRILSHPILGWEDWIDKKPVRYKMNEKPEYPQDLERPMKHFWAMIVWNYTEQKIQIFQVTQATIIREIESLVNDSDWGTPFHYDIKIKKTGKDMLTKYTVTAVPHKAITQEIKSAYEAKPIYLDALFYGADPFQVGGTYTEGCFYFGNTDVLNEKKMISADQVREIVDMIGDDKDYKKTLLDNLNKKSGVNCFENLPENMYESVIKAIKMHNEKRLQQEMKGNSVPF